LYITGKIFCTRQDLFDAVKNARLITATLSTSEISTARFSLLRSLFSCFVLNVIRLQIFSGTRMATEGLPLVRQERGADRGLLTGADFLSVFMSSSLRHAYRETTTTTTPEPTTIPPDSSYTRATRSTSSLTSPLAQSNTEETSFYDTTLSAQLQKLEQSSDSSLDDGVVVAVSVSSTLGRTLINKDTTGGDIEDTTVRETTTSAPTEFPDQNLVASEEHPSIVAEANKSEFSVEESEPITTNSDLIGDFVRGYLQVCKHCQDNKIHHLIPTRIL
jgi:hypothetical protein